MFLFFVVKEKGPVVSYGRPLVYYVVHIYIRRLDSRLLESWVTPPPWCRYECIHIAFSFNCLLLPKTRRFFLFNEKILLRSSFLLQKYSFSFKLQTFCREILRFNTILSSNVPFSPTFVSRFLHYTLLYIGRKKKKKLFRRNVINFPTRRYLFREQVTERGKLILNTCPFWNQQITRSIIQI